jgi:catechol 2,3-dioxygenase-like lactoylglutathione lyase family enzyme
MKVSGISGITYSVGDLARTAEFYQTIGFRRGKEQPDRLTFYVNWFFVTFIDENRAGDAERQDEAPHANKGSGLFVHIKVDNIDDFHSGVVARGIEPASEPQNRHGGGREFVLRDPDGYQLVFFEKK